MDTSTSSARDGTAAAGRKAGGRSVAEYFSTTESRVGYRMLLGDTKHFGWYQPGQSKWRLRRAMRQMEDQLAARLDLQAGGRVVDAGCGVGDVACRLAGQHGLEVTGVDLLPWHVAEARRRARQRGVDGRTAFRQASFSETGLPAGSFDGVYTMETLVHSDDVNETLRHLWKLLRPGGRLVLFEYAHVPYAEMPPRARWVFEEIGALGAMPQLDEAFAHGRLEERLEQVGFVDVGCEDVTPRVVPMLEVFALLARVPYAVLSMLGRHQMAVNAMSAVETRRYLDLWGYQIRTATKPD